MSSIVVNGDTSGSVTLSAPTVAGTVTVTLPSASGTMAVSGGSTSFTDLAYTGTLTGGTGVVNLGSGQVYKDASGNVGIGTVSPTANRKLDAVISANASAGIRVTNSNGGTSTSSNTSYSNGTSNHEFGILGTAYTTYGVLAASEAYIYGSNQSISFGADGASAVIKFGTGAGIPERARIDSSGNLIMASRTLGATGQIQAGRTANTSSVNGYVVVAGGASDPFPIGVRGESTNQGFVGFFDSTNTEVGRIGKSGSNTTYITSSDYRLKEAIVPMSGALATVAALKPCTYKWKRDGSDGQGFIAHELQAVVPDCVHGEKDAVDADGNPQYQGIDTSFLVATLAAAIQELKAIVDAQGAEIAALKGAI